MSKKVLLKTIIPASMAIAVVGSGYGVWFFNNTMAGTSSAADLKLTAAVCLDGLTSSIKGDVLLDQSADINTDDPTLVLTVDYKKILSLSRNADGTTYTNNPVTETSSGVAASDDEKISFTYSISTAISGGLENYISIAKIGGNDVTDTTESGAGKETGKVDIKHDKIGEKTTDNYPITLKWDFGYPDKINTFAKYQELYATVAKSSILITTNIDSSTINK
jgi:hypothetical protein